MLGKVVDKIFRTMNIQVLSCFRQALNFREGFKDKTNLYYPNPIELLVNFKMTFSEITYYISPKSEILADGRSIRNVPVVFHRKSFPTSDCDCKLIKVTFNLPFCCKCINFHHETSKGKMFSSIYRSRTCLL